MKIRLLFPLLYVCMILPLSCEDCFEKEDSSITYKVPTDSFLQKEDLKVLDIGNSYTDDATDLLPLLVQSSNESIDGMSLYKATRGGASFKNWCDIYYDRDRLSGYNVSHVIGDVDERVPTGRGMEKDGRLFRRLLSEVQWDLIIIHQVSNYAPYYDQWKTNDSGGYLDLFLSLLKQNQPNAKIGFLLVHSYSSNCSGNIEHSSYERWRLIALSVKKLCEEYDIDYVIPYGTAVQNLRASSLNDSYDLTRDDWHCGIGLCRYTAACCYYESIIAPRTGVSVIGNRARFRAPRRDEYYPPIDVTDENALIAQKAAFLAYQNWYNCINPENFDMPSISCFPNTL